MELDPRRAVEAQRPRGLPGDFGDRVVLEADDDVRAVREEDSARRVVVRDDGALRDRGVDGREARGGRERALLVRGPAVVADSFPAFFRRVARVQQIGRADVVPRARAAEDAAAPPAVVAPPRELELAFAAEASLRGRVRDPKFVVGRRRARAPVVAGEETDAARGRRAVRGHWRCLVGARADWVRALSAFAAGAFSSGRAFDARRERFAARKRCARS
mmetsp:Transcript_5911/g.18668  ORF Transcript_5911/g.18668 Transcript_5911/m.18668 type:complete len:218 (+) Transcript_5911:148-801(+)